MNVIFRAAAAYLVLLFAVQLMGRRTASMMADFDYAVLFLFGGSLMAGGLGTDYPMTTASCAMFPNWPDAHQHFHLQELVRVFLPPRRRHSFCYPQAQ